MSTGIALASVAIVLTVLLLSLTFLWWIRRKRLDLSAPTAPSRQQQSVVLEESSETKGQRFTFKELVAITDNFKSVIGVGGFGKVFHGKLADGYQVAVKFRSQLNLQATKEFHTEIQLLSKLRHKNLVCLVGYCEEETCQALIYEYLPRGSLKDHLAGEAPEMLLSWRERLHILLEAAKGLEYLHGCKPPVVHRDVKTSNILLGNNFVTKLADLGLSKTFKDEADTHVSTVVAGTPGYLDPEYYSTSLLKEKSDVYSFGIVLLEVMTGVPAIVMRRQNIHIIDFVEPWLSEGSIARIVDSRLEGEYDANSTNKVAELARKCIMPLSARRPTMRNVLEILKQCLALEIARANINGEQFKVIDINDEDSVEVPFAAVSNQARYFSTLDTYQTSSNEIPSVEMSAVANGPTAR